MVDEEEMRDGEQKGGGEGGKGEGRRRPGRKKSWWVVTISSRSSFMPRELNDRLLMKTYYVVVEDVSFNARAVNSPLRNPLVSPYVTLRSASYSNNAGAWSIRERIDFALAKGGCDQCQC